MSTAWPPALAHETLRWLVPEASARRYARLTRPRRHAVTSAVLMAFARGTAPEEVRRVLRATEQLAAAGVPVPGVLDADPEHRWILTEDLGDLSLARAVAAADADQVQRWYAEALAILDRFEGLQLDTCPHPALGRTRLRRELDHFVRGAIRLPDGPGPALTADLERLVTLCLQPPTRLCHRDYHARNLFVKDGRLRVLDHQDALPGPAPYDRVSLAYDPYVQLEDATRDRLAGSAAGTAPVAVQRLAKAIGTYAHLGEGWNDCIAPAARQARRLISRAGLQLTVLDAALAPLSLAAA